MRVLAVGCGIEWRGSNHLLEGSLGFVGFAAEFFDFALNLADTFMILIVVGIYFLPVFLYGGFWSGLSLLFPHSYLFQPFLDLSAAQHWACLLLFNSTFEVVATRFNLSLSDLLPFFLSFPNLPDISLILVKNVVIFFLHGGIGVFPYFSFYFSIYSSVQIASFSSKSIILASFAVSLNLKYQFESVLHTKLPPIRDLPVFDSMSLS